MPSRAILESGWLSFDRLLVPLSIAGPGPHLLELSLRV